MVANGGCYAQAQQPARKKRCIPGPSTKQQLPPADATQIHSQSHRAVEPESPPEHAGQPVEGDSMLQTPDVSHAALTELPVKSANWGIAAAG